MATIVDQVERLKELQSLVLDVHSNLYRMRTIGKHRGFVYEYQHGDDGRMVKVYHDGRIEDGGEEPWQATSIAVSRLGGFPVGSITEAIRPACAPVEPIAWVRDLVERSHMLMHGYSVDGPDWEPRAAAIWHAGAVSLNFAIAQAVAVATSAGDAPDAIAAEEQLADQPAETELPPATIPAETDQQATVPTILIGWTEILTGIQLHQKHKSYVESLNKNTNGPIRTKKGGKPTVDAGKLAEWWTNLMQANEDRREQESVDRENLKSQTGDSASYDYGKSGSIIDGIGGIKNRRSDKKPGS